mgnify:CR=1 FL=1
MTSASNINPCRCGRVPEIHSRWLDGDEEIFDGIVCPNCEIGAYSGDPLSSGDESANVIADWNSLVSSGEESTNDHRHHD